VGPAFVESLPVGKFHDMEHATSAKMNSLGLKTSGRPVVTQPRRRFASKKEALRKAPRVASVNRRT
jgi:hypothetical protein